jgi:hypothetical protein
MNKEDKYSEEVYKYILTQYGKIVLKKVQSDKYKSIISKMLKTGMESRNGTERIAKKIITMVKSMP